MGRLKEYMLVEKEMRPKDCASIVEHIDDIKELLKAGFTRKQIVKCLEEIGVQISYLHFCRKLRDMNRHVDNDSLAEKEVLNRRYIEL